MMAREVVRAEVGGRFAQPDDAVRALGHLAVGFSPIGVADALLAGQAWRRVRQISADCARFAPRLRQVGVDQDWRLVALSARELADLADSAIGQQGELSSGES